MRLFSGTWLLPFLTAPLLLSQSNAPVTGNLGTATLFPPNAHSGPAPTFREVQRLRDRAPWIPAPATLSSPQGIRDESLLSSMHEKSGDALFLTASTFSSGARFAIAMAVEDVNGDGKPDLVVANRCDSSSCTTGVISVFIGKGDGTFSSPVSYGSGGESPTSISIADVNGDKNPDLIVTNLCADSSCANGAVSVLLGNGDGTFKPAVSYNTGGVYASAVVVGDLNGDGKPDLAVANECNYLPGECTSGLVGVLFGNGDGTFSLSGAYGSGGVTATSIAQGDLNGDGKVDLVVAAGCTSTSCTMGTVSVLLNKGNGTFDSAASYNTGEQNSEPGLVALADVNGDGKLDLITGNACSNQDCTTSTVSVLLGNGNGTFQTGTSYSSGGTNPTDLKVADINGDGYPDLEVVNQCDYDSDCLNGTVSVLAGNGDGTFRAAVGYGSAGLYTESVAVADVNGDGRPDLLITNDCSDNGCTAGEVALLLGKYDGTFRAASNYASGGQDNNAIVAADLKRNGEVDLVVVSACFNGLPSCPDGGIVGVLIGEGHGFKKAVTYGSGGSDPHSVAVGDVNGDGKPDLVVANVSAASGGGGVGVLLGNGDGTFQPAMTFPSGAANADSVKIADVNRDGIPDIVVANECGNSNCTSGAISVLLGKGNGTFQQAVNYDSAGQYASSVAVADVNRDGKPDLIASNWCVSSGNCANGTISVLLGNGDGTFQPAVTYGTGGQSSSPVEVADLNRDGILDLVVANEDSVGVLLGNGNGTFQTATVTATPAELDSGDGSLAIRDFNGDGKLDIASGAAGVLLLGNGDGTFKTMLPLGEAGRGLAAGRFGRNGRLDLVDTGVTVLQQTSDLGR